MSWSESVFYNNDVQCKLAEVRWLQSATSDVLYLTYNFGSLVLLTGVAGGSSHWA